MNQADIEQRLREDAEVRLMLTIVERLDLRIGGFVLRCPSFEDLGH
ncbi:hypothetical protein OVA29_10055 [Exiguobacterium sp. SL14]|nr:hypothetical protein [Exiguobacterium sp. SL14]MCY1690967.1 hypothetical protein [Exiguobacterium sp. SL14]